jgi:hypothetical protein
MLTKNKIDIKIENRKNEKNIKAYENLTLSYDHVLAWRVQQLTADCLKKVLKNVINNVPLKLISYFNIN